MLTSENKLCRSLGIIIATKFQLLLPKKYDGLLTFEFVRAPH